MSTLETYINLVEKKIANDSDLFYSFEMKRLAINDAVLELCQQYDINELRVTGTINFISGMATIPADLAYMDKLWQEDGNGNILYVYNWEDPDVFDSINDNSYAYWTVDYDTGAADHMLFIKKVETITLETRYYKPPTEMTESGDDSGLTSKWDEAIAYQAAAKLYENADRPQEAQYYFSQAAKRAKTPVLFTRNQGGIKDQPGFKSQYARTGYLNRRR
jgi:hypothetical protein